MMGEEEKERVRIKSGFATHQEPSYSYSTSKMRKVIACFCNAGQISISLDSTIEAVQSTPKMDIAIHSYSVQHNFL